MSDNISPRTVGKFLKALNTNRKEIVELTFDDAAKRAEADGGTTLFEVLNGDEYYVAFTDCDHYCDTIERPSREYIDLIQEKMTINFSKLIGKQYEYNDEFTLRMATRHGIDPKKKVFKLSFRCFLLGFVIRLADMRDLIVRKGLDKAGEGSFDVAPYNKNQLLGCVGFYKTEQDRRKLESAFNLDGREIPLEDFMVQNTTGREKILRYTANEEDEDDDSEELSTEDGFDSPLDFEGSSRFAPAWDIVERLVMNLSVPRRCGKESYHNWVRVGWAIAGVARAAKNFEEGLSLWLRFCQQCMSLYSADPGKPFTVYQKARYQKEQLGWRSLMKWLKEDNPAVFDEIRERLGSADAEVITDTKLRKIVSSFINAEYRCRPESITTMKVVRFVDKKYLVVESSDANCPIIIDKHDPMATIYFVLGLGNMKEKCHHPECRDKHGKIIAAASYPEDLREILSSVLKVDNSPEMVLSKLVRTCD